MKQQKQKSFILERHNAIGTIFVDNSCFFINKTCFEVLKFKERIEKLKEGDRIKITFLESKGD
jgi:hypothetical protein